MNQVFALRSRLLRLRRTVVPMRDLLYRIVNSHLRITRTMLIFPTFMTIC